MKIAVFHNLPSGGAKRALYGYLKFLTESNNIVDVFVPSTADESFLPLRDIVHKVQIFPVRTTLTGYLYSVLKYTNISTNISLRDLELVHKSIAQVINQGDYDAVYCEQDIYIYSPFLLKYLKKPHVYYCQQPPFFRNHIAQNLFKSAGIVKESFLKRNVFLKYYFKNYRKLNSQNMKKAKYVLANSYFSRELILMEYGLNSFVSYLGVDTELFRPLKVPKENFVLSVGRCLPEKGYHFIIRSLAQIDPSIRPELVIVSDQYDRDWKNYLTELAIKNDVKLRILNLISDEELIMLYNKAKIVVYAPYLEPFGFVPLEAMGCGTPVIAVKEGGIRESVIHGKTGMLTDRDEISFANTIVELLSDDHKIEILAKKSIKYVKAFWSLEKAGERLCVHLKHAIDLWE
jgi:glycosyltransferase involved in cell wall biosynthesis